MGNPFEADYRTGMKVELDTFYNDLESWTGIIEDF